MATNSAFERLEDFIWGRLDEGDFLSEVVADEHLDTEKLLSRVQTIQRDLNARLRQGVEENYPRLLEQVSTIEQLDSAHSHFQREMDAVVKRADALAKTMNEQVGKMRNDVRDIASLTKLSRLQGDAIRCEELVDAWREEKDLVRRAELIAEVNAIVKANDKLRHLKWLFDRCLFGLAEMNSRTRQDLVVQLRSALRSLNVGTVSATVKALQQLLGDGAHACQKELNAVMDEALLELDALFLQLSAQPTQDKAAKLLPQLGTKLHSQLEQFQLLGMENAQQFARHVGKVITSRVPANAPYAMRLVQTIYKSLQTHTDSVAAVIRDALNPLKANILSQSLANLFSLVDQTFEQDERRDTIVVEQLNAAFRAELASVGWDVALQREMESNVAKALKRVGTKLEQQIAFGDDALRFIGRISRAQTHNYQLMNIAHELTKHWPGLCAPLYALIQTAVQTILERMRSTVSLVLASMHDENLLVALAPGATSSEYVKELCGHLKVFRQHCAQVKPLADSVEALPAFLNFCVEQFLLHISLIRPIGEESFDRFVRDLEYLCRNGLEAFNCNCAKLLNAHRQFQQLLKLTLGDSDGMQQLAELASHQLDMKARHFDAIPQWFVAHLLICASGTELRLPHDSAGWTIPQYVHWFNTHTEADKWRFLRNLLDAYKHSVVAQGGTEFVRNFPILCQLVDANLLSTTALIA
uniref:Conserved oligomeric Golgi complex subunit 5 n=1 Tax=Globodera rostochiensis TaxID=31243 RepID=A0A914GS03_GLORO